MRVVRKHLLGCAATGELAKTIVTVTRRSRMQGLPPIRSGSTVIRSNAMYAIVRDCLVQTGGPVPVELFESVGDERQLAVPRR